MRLPDLGLQTWVKPSNKAFADALMHAAGVSEAYDARRETLRFSIFFGGQFSPKNLDLGQKHDRIILHSTYARPQ